MGHETCPSIGTTLQTQKSEAPLWGFAFFDPDFLSIDGLIFGASYGNVQVWMVRKGKSLHHTQSGPCSRADRCIFDCQVCVMCPRGSKLFDVNVSWSRLGSFGALWMDSVAVRLCMKICYSCTTWGMCQCLVMTTVFRGVASIVSELRLFGCHSGGRAVCRCAYSLTVMDIWEYVSCL